MRAQGQWAISPLDSQAHLLVPEGDQPPGVLKARCGEVLPTRAVRTTSRPTVVATCAKCGDIVAALFSGRPPMELPSATAAGGRPVPPLPPSQFPAGPRSSSAPETPGGQPVPGSDVGLSDNSRHDQHLRWARCPADQLLHLLTPQTPVTAVAAKDVEAEALCGQVIPPEGLRALEGPTAGLCESCLASAGRAR